MFIIITLTSYFLIPFQALEKEPNAHPAPQPDWSLLEEEAAGGVGVVEEGRRDNTMQLWSHVRPLVPGGDGACACACTRLRGTC